MIETHFHDGPGYEPLLIRDGWQVAQLNYLPELAADAIRRVERHRETDEVFILVRGRSVLFTADAGPGGLRFETVGMLPGVTYNIPAGVWHSIAMTPADIVVIVEKSHTHRNDVEYRDLNACECEQLRSLLGAGPDRRGSPDPAVTEHGRETDLNRGRETGPKA